MEILFAVFGIIYVLWMTSMIVVGQTEKCFSFTLLALLMPLIIFVFLIVSPLAVIFSKTVREEVKRRINENE